MLASCRRALAIDYFRESFHRWIMTAHAAMGDRTLAIAHYEELRRALMRELDAEPDPATAALIERIKSQPETLTSRRPEPNPPASKPPAAKRPAPRAVTSHVPIAPPELPMVGRAHALSELLDALEPQESGAGKFVLVHGEAGIGKTRLVEEAIAALGAAKESPGLFNGPAPKAAFGSILLGHCAPYGTDMSYGPIVECIARYLEQIAPGDLDLDDVWWRHLARLVPGVAAVRPGGASAPESLNPDQDRLALLEAISRFIAALPQPVLLVVEDLHWADNATLDALAFLLGPRRAGAGPTILATSRGETFSPQFNEALAGLERAGRAVRLSLEPLSPGETSELVAHAAKGAPAPAAPRIHAETGGNPLYILELVRYLRETGLLAKEPGDMDQPLPVPPTVERVVAGRLSSLAPAAAEMLKAAAIFPRGTAFFRLVALSGIAEEQALEGFEALSRSGFLRSGDGARIAFNHEIVRRVVEKSMSAPRRIALHRRAHHLFSGEPGSSGAGALVEQLAYHAREGELWEEALHWHQEAARAAEAVFAYSTACKHLDQALGCLEKLASGNGRLEGERLEAELRLRAWRLRLGYWFDPARDESWRDALEEERGADVAGQLPEVLLARAETLYLQGDMNKAEPILRRVLDLVDPSESPELYGYAVGGLGALEMFRGELGRAIDLFTESTALTERAERRLPGKSARLARTACYAMSGRFKECEAEIDELAATEQIRQDWSQAAYLHATEAMAAYLQGRWERAIAAARLGVEKARSAGHRHNEYYASIWEGAALVEAGDIEAGLAALERTAGLARESHLWIMLDWVHAFRSFARLRSGDLGSAREAAAEGLRIAERNGYRLGVALCTEALGRAAVLAGDRAAGEALMLQALRLYSAIGAQPYFDRCRSFLLHVCKVNVRSS